MIRIVIAGLLVAAGALLFAERASAADAGCFVYPSGTTFVVNTRQIMPCIQSGGLVMDIDSVGGTDVPTAGQDNDTNARPGVPTYSRGMLWDGVAWDRQPGSAELGTEVNVPDGQDFTQGALADAACATDTGVCSAIALTKRILVQLTDLLVAYAPTGAAVPAQAVYMGVNVAGNLTGFAPGTSGVPSSQVISVQGMGGGGSPAGSVLSVQGVAGGTPLNTSTAQIGGVSILTGNGPTGTGSQRVTIASDNLPVAQNQTQINSVTLLAGNGVTGTGSQRVTIASDNTPYAVKIDQTTPGGTNAISIANIGTAAVANGNGTSSLGTLRVAVASDNTPYAVKIDQTTPGTTNLVAVAPVAGGGCTPAKTLSAASTNSTLIKTGATTLCSIMVINTTATVYYLKLYNKASAPTCQSDAVLQTYPIPATGATNLGIMGNLGPYGLAFSLGAGFCLTAAIADNDNTAAAVGVAINYSFK